MANTGQLDEHDRERLIRLLGMTGSDHDGEATNAVRLAGRLLRAKGLRWHDIVIPPTLPSPRNPWLDVLENWPEKWVEALKLCQSSPVQLPGKSRDFIETISHYVNRPSPSQLKWLRELVERCSTGAG